MGLWGKIKAIFQSSDSNGPGSHTSSQSAPKDDRMFTYKRQEGPGNWTRNEGPDRVKEQVWTRNEGPDPMRKDKGRFHPEYNDLA